MTKDQKPKQEQKPTKPPKVEVNPPPLKVIREGNHEQLTRRTGSKPLND